MLSFHGIPIAYASAATPTPRTSSGRRAGWSSGWAGRAEQWTQSFQSLFGRERWLKPYTDDVLKRLAKAGVKRVFVAMPGFTADCLETIDEIGHESREVFQHAGGESCTSAPA